MDNERLSLNACNYSKEVSGALFKTKDCDKILKKPELEALLERAFMVGASFGASQVNRRGTTEVEGVAV